MLTFDLLTSKLVTRDVDNLQAHVERLRASYLLNAELMAGTWE